MPMPAIKEDSPFVDLEKGEEALPPYSEKEEITHITHSRWYAFKKCVREGVEGLHLLAIVVVLLYVFSMLALLYIRTMVHLLM
ncbi:hypothetical protein DAKH74_056200 [Maudiozyma humilis]|uniref:Uncharacterized protein n=1 Tax=Maudiozyma humilis TaxID=51915 RepID=A0AAV5S6F4_MAUHU|nr:hypothetical protein DAKH74_056200 [Kazachstania humilis]